MTLTRQTMTDEQRKSVAIEYLKAFDNGGITSTGDSILELFATDAQVMFPKWGLANGREEIGKMFGDVGATVRDSRLADPALLHLSGSRLRRSRHRPLSVAGGGGRRRTRRRIAILITPLAGPSGQRPKVGGTEMQ
jgi:hypothetical protein